MDMHFIIPYNPCPLSLRGLGITYRDSKGDRKLEEEPLMEKEQEQERQKESHGTWKKATMIYSRHPSFNLPFIPAH